MKKLLFIIFTVFALAGCTGATDFFESAVPDGALENYANSGATGLHLYDQNAVNPVTVTPSVSDVYIEHPLAQGCTMSWNVQAIDPVDYQFWLSQPMTITYDANLFSCNATYRCRYNGATAPAVLNGSIYDVPVTCEALP